MGGCLPIEDIPILWGRGDVDTTPSKLEHDDGFEITFLYDRGCDLCSVVNYWVFALDHLAPHLAVTEVPAQNEHSSSANWLDAEATSKVSADSIMRHNNRHAAIAPVEVFAE